MNDSYALLIGVDDYRAYDPSGKHDLGGSCNGVRAWWRMCKALGYKPENVRVLTSPAPDPDEFAGAQVGTATAAEIVEGARWLARMRGADPQASGLLTFSGLGDATRKGLVVCPSNVVAAGDDLENDVALGELRSILEEHGGGRNLTSVIDCCHFGAQTAGGRRVLSLRGRAPRGDFAEVRVGDRTFVAAEADARAYQATFPEGAHGALTWAFMAANDPWAFADRDGRRSLLMSNAEIRRRAHALLDILSFGQAPALHATPQVAARPALEAGPAVAPTGDAFTPPIIGQCDPGEDDYRVYTIWQYLAGNWTVQGYMVCPRVNAPSGSSYRWLAGREYWYMVSNLSAGYTTYFGWADYTWAGTPNPPIAGTSLSFTMVQNASWSSTSVPSASTTLYVNNYQGNVSLSWGMTYSGGVWSGSLTWYSPTGTNTVFGGMPTTYAYLYPSTTPTVNWYAATVSPL